MHTEGYNNADYNFVLSTPVNGSLVPKHIDAQEYFIINYN